MITGADWYTCYCGFRKFLEKVNNGELDYDTPVDDLKEMLEYSIGENGACAIVALYVASNRYSEFKRMLNKAHLYIMDIL